VRLRCGRAFLVALFALLILAVSITSAHAQELDAPLPTKMRFIENANDISVTTAITALFDSASYNSLDSGFPSTVVIRMWVYPRNKNEPVGYALLQRRVVYDLWDEVYVVRLDSPAGTRTVKVKYKAEALKQLTSIEIVPVAPISKIPVEDQFYLALVAELNPVSQTTLAEARRWLSQGTGGGLDRGGSFFGSFVSIFVNLKIPEADRVLRWRSQPFYRQRPPAAETNPRSK
jgi:hypothetical protein